MRQKNEFSITLFGLYSKPYLSQFCLMKSPAEYLAPHVYEARRPRRELQAVVGYDDALRAVEQALADAEKYKYLLMRALRRHADDLAATTPSTHVAPVALPATETLVLSMYPAGLPMAA